MSQASEPGGVTDRPAEQAPPQPTPPTRQLRRSRTDRMLFGVCGGIGRHLGIDPVVVRVAFVLLAAFGGSGIIAYLIAFVVIPEEPVGAVGEVAPTRPRPDVASLIGFGLVALGAVSLANRYLPWLGDLMTPLALIGAGVLILTATVRRNSEEQR
jgi:phage shock protein C